MMVANLAPGGRITSYDPQGYDTYPQGPQGTPDLNILAGLPSVSGYASIVNGGYEATTHTHEQGDLNIAELTSGTLDRLDLQEIVTLPEYFLVPLATVPRSLSEVQQVSEGFEHDPLLERGFGANYRGHAIPLLPWSPTDAACGSVGIVVLRGVAGGGVGAPAVHAADIGRHGTSIRSARNRRNHPLDRPAERAARCGHGRGQAPAADRGRARGPGPRSLAAAPGGHHRERVALRARRCPLLGARSRTVAAGGGDAGLHGLRHRGGLRIRSPPSPHEVVVYRYGWCRARPSPKWSESTRSAPASVIRSVAWDSGWRGSVSVNGGPARSVPVRSVDLVQEIAVPAGDDLVTLPLPAPSPPDRVRPQRRLGRPSRGARYRVAGSAPVESAFTGRRGHRHLRR